MSRICATTGAECENVTFCDEINKPLEQAIPRIRRGVGGVSWNLAKTALDRELSSLATQLSADLSPTTDTDGNASICPLEIIEGDFGRKYGPRVAATAVGNLCEEVVNNVIEDLTKKP